MPPKHDIHELRKAHFQVGFEKNREFATTTALNNAAVTEKQVSVSKNLEEQRARVQKNRAPQYELG